jgi:hypothetical protein
MATRPDPEALEHLRSLLARDHTLNGGILFGLGGYTIEIQASVPSSLNVRVEPFQFDPGTQATLVVSQFSAARPSER